MRLDLLTSVVTVTVVDFFRVGEFRNSSGNIKMGQHANGVKLHRQSEHMYDSCELE